MLGNPTLHAGPVDAEEALVANRSPAKTRIKICGIRDPNIAIHTAQCGINAIGLVFVAGSPRAVSVEEAQAIIAALPPYVSVVGLFRNASAQAVDNVLNTCALDMLQFHGDEPPEYCESFVRPYVKAIPMLQSNTAKKNATDWLEYACSFTLARGYLFDSHAPDVMGGSGKTFDWEMLVEARKVAATAEEKRVFNHLVLAGGLHPGNVADAIQHVQPWAVDVSSGVESARGIKDYAKIKQFADAVRAL